MIDSSSLVLGEKKGALTHELELGLSKHKIVYEYKIPVESLRKVYDQKWEWSTSTCIRMEAQYPS